MAGIGGSDGSFYEDHFDQVTGNNGNGPDTASGMALEASRKAAGALKRAKGTLPTFDSDTGINGPVLHSIAGLREQGIDPNITEGQENQATDLAMSFSGGGLTFGGVKSIANLKGAAKNEALSNLGHAQVLEANGVHPDIINQQTGFHRGAEGKWKYEINDSKSSFDRDWFNNLPKNNNSARLSDILDHPELYQRYPQLKNTNVVHDPSLEADSAYYSASENKIVLSTSAASNQGTLMHEVQHALQDYEGFAKGGSPGIAGKTYNLKLADLAKEKIYKPLMALQDKYHQHLLEELTNLDTPKNMITSPLTAEEEAERRRLTSLAQKFSEYAKAGDEEAAINYLRLAGETESRNVSNRLLMTEEERRRFSPIYSEYPSRRSQIVRDEVVSTDPYMK